MNVRNEIYQEISYLSPHKAFYVSFIGLPSSIQVSRRGDYQLYTSIFCSNDHAVYSLRHILHFIFTSVHGLQNKAGVLNKRVFTQIHAVLHQEHIITIIWS